MKNLQKIMTAIYDTLAIKAKSIGTHDNTILVSMGKDLFEVTVRKVEQNETPH